MRFPFKEKPDSEQARHAARIIWAVTAVTLLPSIYFAYEIVQDSRFVRRAERFIEHEAVIPGDYLLQKTIDPARRAISLTFGGKPIDAAQIAALKSRLAIYQLDGTNLQIRQGFATDSDKKDDAPESSRRDARDRLATQILDELAAQNVPVLHLALEEGHLFSSATDRGAEIWLAAIITEEPLTPATRSRVREWLRVRLQAKDLAVAFEVRSSRTK